MSDPTDDNDVADMYAARLDAPDDTDDGGEERDADDGRAVRDERADDAQSAGHALPAESAWRAEKIKRDWDGNKSVYLPEALGDQLDDEFRRVQYELGGDVKKDRHYKPLVVLLGLEALGELDGAALAEEVRRLVQMEWAADD